MENVFLWISLWVFAVVTVIYCDKKKPFKGKKRGDKKTVLKPALYE